MARSLDPIGAQLPLSHNPLIRIGYQPPRQNLKIEDLIKQWQQGWQQFGFTALKEITHLDFSSPQALVLSLGDLIGDATQDVLKTLAKVFRWGGIGIPSGEELTRWVGQQVFGLIDPSRLPQIPLGAIVKSSPNLLSNGSFSDAAAILDSAGKWVVDNTVYRTAPGSARTTADGTIRELLSVDLIPVKPGQKLDVSGYVKYSGLTASAGAVQLGLTTFGPDKESVVSRPQIAVLGAVSNATANWPQTAMSGTYTTPATGVSYVRLRLTVSEGATAGTVWFDDLVAHVGGNLLSIDWIDGLAQQLIDFANGLGAAVQDIANRLTMATWQAFLDAVKGGPGGLIEHIVDKLQHLGFDGKFDAAQLFNIAGSAIQTFMDTVGGTVGASMTDVFNRLSKLGANGTIVGSAITGAIAEAQTGMDFFRDFLVNGMGGSGSGFTNTDAKNQAIQLQQTAAQAAAATAAIQAQFQRQQATVPSGLLSYITTFGGPDGVSLPVEFTGLDLKIRTGNGYCGIDGARGDGTYYAANNKQATTDDVQVTVVLGDAGGLNSIATYVLFSSDGTYTTGAYFGLNGAQAFVGKYTRSGATFTFAAPFMSWSGPLGQGLSATVYRRTNNWVLEVGGDVKATASDSTVTTGASNRSGGAIVMQRKTASGGWFDGNHLYDSLRLASLYFGDFYAKTSFYSGGKMTRPGASPINGPGHSYSLPQGSSTTFSGVLPSNFFSLQNFASDDVTVNVANGSITVNTPGLYYVHYDLPWTTVSFGAGISANGVFTDVVVNTVNHIPLVSQETQTIPAGADGSGGGSISLYWDKPEFLRLSAGDVVQLGYTLGIKNGAIGGTRTGTANMAYAAGSGFFGIYKLG